MGGWAGGGGTLLGGSTAIVAMLRLKAASQCTHATSSRPV